MNKTYKSSMMALSAVAFFTSCSESESLQQAHLSTDQINFIASMAHQWDANDKSAPQNPSSRSAGERDNEAPIHVNANLAKPLYLHLVVQDGIHIWSKQGTPITRSGAPIEDVEQERVVQTRGSMKNNLSDYTSFNVSAVNTHDNPESLFFGYQKAASVTSNSTTTWHVSDDGIKCWPVAPATLSFYAYAPTDNSMVSSGADAAGVKTVHYKATTPVTDQPDLIVSSAAESRPSNAKPTAVNLPFYHALTAVTFSVDAAMMPGTLTKVELVNVNTEGDCTMTASATPSTPSFSWSNQTTPSTFSFDFNQPVGSSAVTLTSGEKTLMMVPQELPADAKVNFTFTLNNGVSQTLSAPIGGKEWEAGKSIIYKLSTKTISTISAANVSFPTTWNDTETVKASYPKSEFVDGESIGLYVVEKTTGKLVGRNIKLTKKPDGWKLDDDKDKFMFLTRYNYFAYYPYSTTDPEVTAVADADQTATEFFVNTISNWNPAKNQRSELLSQDLQVAKGVIEGDASTLKFPMEHSMGLAVLNLKSRDIAKTRRFKNNSYTYYYPNLTGRVTTKPTKDTDYTDDATKQSVSASTAFSGYIPYKTSTANRYLQIVKPSTDISFKASDESGKPRSAWGTLTPCTFNVAKNAVMSKEIKTDADFYYLARVYTCTQKVEEFKTPIAGDYQIECWGAQGGGVQSYPGGKGSYTKGSISLDGVMLYVVVGQIGGYEEAFNNGFPGRLNFYFSGGGATDIRLNNKNGNWKDFVSRKSRIMVAASGGGSVIYFSNQQGMAGGSLSGFSGTNSGSDGIAATPGVQTSCGKAGTGCLSNGYKGIGFGIVDYQTSEDNISMGSAGNGYYCGGVGNHGAGTVGVGATGSCFISGHPGCDAIKESSTENAIVHTGQPNHYSGLVFTDTEMIDGQSPMPSPKGGTETGHLGDGVCIVTQLSFK